MTDITVDVMGVKMAPRPPEFSRKWTPMAFIDITIPELQLEVSGALLAHQKGKFLAHPPKPTLKGAGVQWAINSPLARTIAEKAVKQYAAIGGKMPPEPKPQRQFIPLHELELSPDEGLPMEERVEDALEIESRKRGVECFTEIWTRSQPEADDDEAVDGLHRMLGVDPAVTEACDRAGL